MTRLELLELANAVAESVQSEYTLTTGSQYTEESVTTEELTMTILAVLKRYPL